MRGEKGKECTTTYLNGVRNFEAFGLGKEERGLNRNITFSQRCN